MANTPTTCELEQRVDDAATKLAASDIVEHMQGAAEAFRREDYASAVDHLTEALRINPGLADALVQRANAYGHLGRHANALADLDGALAVGLDAAARSQALMLRGWTCCQLSRDEDAERDLSAAIDVAPLNWLAREWRSRLRLSTDFDGCIADCSKLIEAGVGDVAAHLRRRGECHREMSRPREALVDFDQSVERDPSNWRTVLVRGCLHQHEKRYELALRDLTRVLELRPEHISGWNCRAECYLELGLPGLARDDCLHARKLDPKHFGAAIMHVRSLIALGDTAAALAELERAEELAAGDPEKLAAVREERLAIP